MSQVYIPKALREKVTTQAKYRCRYCLSQELVTGTAMEFDHLIPLADGGQTVEENLWLACSTCNDTKNKRRTAIDLYQVRLSIEQTSVGAGSVLR
jgi:5-methylcytosine-specific restriction endonuclease McrA